MQVQQLERFSAPAPAPANQVRATELERLVSGLRWRLGFESLAVFAMRGAIASGLAVIGLTVAIWLAEADQTFVWFGATPLVAALIFGLVRWPSRQSTAIAVDRRFGLEERLATAVELADGGRVSRYAGMQIQDAVTRTRAARGLWLSFDRDSRKQAFLLAAVVVLTAAVLVVVPRLARPISVASPPVDTAALDAPPAADDLAQRAIPLDANEEDAIATPVAARSAAPSADLAARVQQEQAERSALDSLAQALGASSAAKPAADAIQQGDFNAARDQLQTLGDNADQLSEAAKQQLARGLQQAAATTAQTDRSLADREQQAAQALARSTYADQRQALRSLGDQVQRSGSRSVPSDQLERDLGQLQQQGATSQATNAAGASRSSTGAAQSGASQSGASQTGQDQSGQQGGDQGAGMASGGQNGAGAGQQIGAGVGNGTDPNLYSDQSSRLDSTGQQVQVPLKLGNGQAVRPADGSEDQAAPDPKLGGRTTAELAQEQQTGQVTPEQNLVPGEQRPVVRGYFR